MSRTVDDRVVSLQFNNRQFESNVSQTMSTLDKLKQKLNLPGSVKAFDNINASANKVNLNGISSGVDTLQAKFSALQVAAVTALANITNSAVNAGKRIASALTITPIMDGLREYETQINSVQTILANTQSKGTNIDQVNAALDELNKYADQTIYNFGQMTHNIGTFTAAGVDLDKSVTAIKGIANLAAMSGSNATQAATAMYQLSQALAAGRVSLMDWNSVVNAGMGGEVFQNALKRTAENFGYDVDSMIKKYGSFRESLTKGGWLTAEVLTETLTQLSGAYTEADLIAQGYTEQQAKEITTLAKTALGAATEVKTFSGLIDTTKEALGSGWAQSFRIILGDFEEAKELFTGISNVLSDMVNKSADARNKVLQGWKDLGGRDSLIKGFANIFEGLSSIITPIQEAFRNIFPPITSKQLFEFTKGFEELTSKLKVSDETAKNIRKTFEGVFSVLKVGVDAVSAIGKGFFDILGSIFGLSDGLLGITGGIGEFLTGISKAISEANIFGNAIDFVVGVITGAIDVIKEIGSSIAEAFDGSLIKGITEAFSGLISIFTSADLKNGIGVLNTGIFSGILLSIKKFIDGLGDSFGEGGILSSIKGVLNDVRESLEAYQNNIKAGTLQKIAVAVGILAASLFVLSTIDGAALARSLGALTVIFVELGMSLRHFSKITADLKSVIKAVPLMIGIASAVLILAGAMKALSTIDTEGIIKGLAAVGVLMFEISMFVEKAKFGPNLISNATGIVILSSALLVLSKAVESFGSMDWGTLGKGLASVAAVLLEISAFAKLTAKAENLLSTGASLVMIGASMKLFAESMKSFGSMNWDEIGKSLVSMAGSLLIVTRAINGISYDGIITKSASLIVIGEAMKILADGLKQFGSMDLPTIAKGLLGMGGALYELSLALKSMKDGDALKGSAAILVAAGAIGVLAPALKTLGSMSWEGLAVSLVALAGAFTVLGVAGYILGPMVPVLLGLTGALALLGASVGLIGAGIAAIGLGVATLASSLSVGITTIVAAQQAIILGVAQTIPEVAKTLAEGVVAFAELIGKAAPKLGESVYQLILGIMQTLAKYVPEIANALFDFLIGVINTLAERTPELIAAFAKLLGAVIQGVIDALNGLDGKNLLNGTLVVAGMTALVYGLATVASMIPAAMVGLAGIGLMVAELGVILAALGALNQIPGLDWLINEGGDFLQSIGTAIGQFVGGVAGGFMEGATSTLPKVAQSLSEFMIGLMPFIEGAKQLDSSMLEGVSSLAGAILMLTGANLLDGIASFLTGGSSLSKFAKEIVPFGKAMKEYSDSVADINPEAVTASATAAKSLAELAKNLPNSGGIAGFFAGENDLDIFAEKLKPFGKAMKEYSQAVSGIDKDAIVNSATAAKSLAELSNNLPNSGGLAGFFAGENDISTWGEMLVPFGKSLKEYSDSIAGINPDAITASATAGKALSELANTLPNSGGVLGFFAGENDISTFGDMLVPFGKGMKAYSDAIKGIDPEAITGSATAGMALSELANSLPNSGGLLGFFAGENDLSTFGEMLVPFGEGMVAYSDAIKGMDVAAVNGSATAGQALAELANSLPNAGGLMGLFTGEKSLSSLGYQLVPFGEGLKQYSDAIVGINPEAVSASATAAQALGELYAVLPNVGGLLSLFTGEKSMSTFGAQLVPFGMGLKMYSIAVSGMDTEAITSSSVAVNALANLAAALPSVGGVVSFFTGEKNMATFGAQLVPFGMSLKMYSMAISGINADAITASATAAQALAQLATSLPSMGGLISFFTGEQDLSTFGSQLMSFGFALKMYSIAIAGISPDAITASATAAQALVALAKDLPSFGGLISFFTGEQDLATFGTQLSAFGDAMKKYGEAVAELPTDAITNSATAAESMIKVAKKLPEAAGLFSNKTDLTTFGSQMVSFGDSLKKYGESIAGVSAEAISSSATAVQSLVKAVKSMSGISTSGATAFTQSINTLATANVSGFVSAFSGQEGKLESVGKNLGNAVANGFKSATSALKSAATSMAEAAVSAAEAKASSFKSAGTKLSDKLVEGLKTGESKAKSAVKTMVSSAAEAASGYYNTFYSAGQSVASGFAAGISAGTFAAVAKASAMASQAASAAKAALDINSPSKVFRAIGKSVPEGFAQGIGMLGGLVNKSVMSMSNNAIDGTKSAIARISDAINSDIDAQPTIRPVVDLSDVSSSARAINGMLGMTPSIGTLSAVGSISARMNRRQNGANSDVVDAIKDLDRSIAKSSGPSYTINGITYDRGTEVADAIETLVRATRIEGRV